MKFILKPPFRNWSFPLYRNKGEFSCQIDSGSNLTLVGFNVAHSFGFHKQITSKSRCVLLGTSSEHIAFAIKVHSVEILLDNHAFVLDTAFIPFVNSPEHDAISWISADELLIGTDILNNYNMTVNFEGKGSVASSAYLSLSSHGFVYALEESEDYSISEALEILQEQQEPIDTGYTSKLSQLGMIMPSNIYFVLGVLGNVPNNLKSPQHPTKEPIINHKPNCYLVHLDGL